MKRLQGRAASRPQKRSPEGGTPAKRGRTTPVEVGIDELLDAASDAVVLTGPPACHQLRVYGYRLPDGPFWRFVERTVGDPGQLWRTAILLAVMTGSVMAILLTASVAVRLTGLSLGAAAVLAGGARMAGQRRGTARS